MTFAPEFTTNGFPLLESDEAYGDEASYDEAYGDESSSDEAYGDEASYEEARRSSARSRTQQPVRTSRPSTFSRPQPPQPPAGQGANVTVTMLETRLATLRAELVNSIRTNSRAITNVDNKVRTVDTRQSRIGRQIGRDFQQVRQQNAQTRDTIMLLTLLNRPSVRTITEDTSGLVARDRVVLDSDGIGSFLPFLLLMGGMGGSTSGSDNGQGGGGGMFGGGEGGGIGMLALLLLTQQPQR